MVELTPVTKAKMSSTHSSFLLYRYIFLNINFQLSFECFLVLDFFDIQWKVIPLHCASLNETLLCCSSLPCLCFQCSVICISGVSHVTCWCYPLIDIFWLLLIK